MPRLSKWMVYTPEYGEVVPILDYGMGPLEYIRDVVTVLAKTKYDAKILGVKLMRKMFPKGYINSDTYCCPFTGLGVEPY